MRGLLVLVLSGTLALQYSPHVGTATGTLATIVVIVIPLLVMAFLTVRRPYDILACQLSLDGFPPPMFGHHHVVLLVSGIHRGVVTALNSPKAVSPDVTAITVSLDPTATSRLWMQWQERSPDVPPSSSWISHAGPR